jgi:hypothetical protein
MSTVQVDAINESTTNAGVTVDGVLIKDGAIASSYITGAGKVLQVVTGVTTTNSSNTTADLADTGLSASITPTSASNKILVMVAQHYLSYRANTAAGARIALLRDTTVIVGNTSYDIIQGYASTNENKGIHTIVYMDSPSTTSATTYKTQHRVESATNSAVIEMSRNSHPSSIVLMEIEV